MAAQIVIPLIPEYCPCCGQPRPRGVESDVKAGLIESWLCPVCKLHFVVHTVLPKEALQADGR